MTSDIPDDSQSIQTDQSRFQRGRHRGGWIAAAAGTILFAWSGDPGNAFIFAGSYLFAYIVSSGF